MRTRNRKYIELNKSFKKNRPIFICENALTGEKMRSYASGISTSYGIKVKIKHPKKSQKRISYSVSTISELNNLTYDTSNRNEQG